MIGTEKPDVVSVATPNRYHKPVTIAALRAGCHVLCEKPMALNAAEAREMVAVASQADKRLMINYSWRFTDASWALKARVAEGALGEIYFGRTVWHRRRGIPASAKAPGGAKALQGGGPMVDLGVHRLDLALWFMGFPQAEWVMGATYNPIGKAMAEREGWVFDVEDMAAAFVRFRNGATLAVEAFWAANIAERELMETRILGTKGGLIQRNADEGYARFDGEIYTERNGAQFDEKLHLPLHPPAPKSMHHFADCIADDRPHVATAEQGLAAMEILDAMYESAATGAPVRVGQ